jgi:hypothetical protein
MEELKMPYQTRYELVETIYKHAIASLVVAVAGQKVPREPYSQPIKDAAENLVEAFKAGAIYEDFDWRVDKNADDAITALVEALDARICSSGSMLENGSLASKI